MSKDICHILLSSFTLYLPGWTREVEMQSQAVQLVFHPRFQPWIFEIPRSRKHA